MCGVSSVSFWLVCPNEYPRRFLLWFGMLPSAPVDKQSGKAKRMAWWNQYFHLQANFVFRDAGCQTRYWCICGVTLHFCLWTAIKGFNNLFKIIQILLLLWAPLFLNSNTSHSLQNSLPNVFLPSFFCFHLLLISSLLSHILYPAFYALKRFLVASYFALTLCFKPNKKVFKELLSNRAHCTFT